MAVLEEALCYLNSRGQLAKISRETFDRIQVLNTDIVKAFDLKRAEVKTAKEKLVDREAGA